MATAVSHGGDDEGSKLPNRNLGSIGHKVCCHSFFFFVRCSVSMGHPTASGVDLKRTSSASLRQALLVLGLSTA